MGPDVYFGETSGEAPLGEGLGLRFCPAVARQATSTGLCSALDRQQLAAPVQHAEGFG